ncbi:MAG: hypothetical protein LJU34_08970 [Oscillospiraceae bacterium]|nr:hypothetical protein [Oscillospiraceae bacterium]
MIGVIGILIAFVFLFYFSIKGLNLTYLSLIACVIIMVTNGMPIVSTISDVVMSGVGTQAASLLLIYLLGGILGALFVNSGAATSIASGLLNLFGKNASVQRRQMIGLIVAFVIGAVLTYCGIDNFSVIFTMMAIVSSLMRETNIPRRYLPVLLIAPTAVGALMPGSLYIASLVASQVLGVRSTAGFVPGLVVTIFVAVVSLFYLKRMINKDTAAGKGWTEPEANGPQAAVESKEKLPHPIVACLPLVAVIVCYNLIGMEAFAAIAIGVIFAVVLFFPYLNSSKSYTGSNRFFAKCYGVVDSLNEGVGNAGIPAIMLISFGLASCIQGSPAYEIITSFFTGVSLPAALSLALVSTVLVGASCGPAGMMIAAALAADAFIPAGSITAAAAFRILVTTATVFDTLPCFPGPATIFQLTGIKMKDGYGPVGMTTLLFTAIAVVIVTVLFILFPGL